MKNYSTNLRYLFAGGLCLILAACGGSSGGVSTADSGSPDSGTPAPTITFNVTPGTVSVGGSVVASWSSGNADSCEASGGWSGNKETSGTETVGPIQQDTTLSLSCSGAGGGAVRSFDVMVDQGVSSNVVLSADPENVVPGGTSTLSWSATGATSCSSSGAWSGGRALSGSEVVGPLSSDASYQLTCDGPSGSSVAMVTVRVVDKALRWQAPTQNVDGTPLTDLAGYTIYWGTQSRNYTGSQPINSPATTQWEVNLAPGEYFFAMTAVDSDNNESAYSNEVLKLIP